MSSISFKVQYKAGHSYTENWKKLDLYCPNCGKQTVWHETGGGDYYAGEEHMCLSCIHAFFLYGGPNLCSSWQDKQRFEALNSVASASP